MTSIDFTTEEILGLASSLALSTPSAFSNSPIESWSPEIRHEVDSLGMRSLIARGLARTGTSGGLEVPTALTTMCSTLCEPIARVAILRLGSDGPRVVTFYIRHEATAGLRPTVGGNHSVSLFPTEYFGNAVLEVLRLPASSPQSDSPIDLDADELERFASALAANPTPATGGQDDLASLLGESELSEESAAAIQMLAVDGASGHIVRVSVPSENGTGVSGSITAWIEQPDGSLFLVEPTYEAERAKVRVAPVDRTVIVHSIDEGCPEWMRIGNADGLQPSASPS